MRQNIIIALTILIVVTILIVLNAATYISEEKLPDSELAPNRSTYHSGPTGTRAFYDFLSESGQQVMRWRQPPAQLLGTVGRQVQTFVVVGPTQLRFEDEQAASLLKWVADGGWLVVIDRAPPKGLLPKSGAWVIGTEFADSSAFGTDPTDADNMTKNVNTLQPTQPSILTREVEAVSPSRLASKITIFADPTQEDAVTIEAEHKESHEDQASKKSAKESSSIEATSPAPVVYLGDPQGGLLVDCRHGQGRIVLLSDPYLVANNGIGLKDNLQLALNLVTASGGLIAFDEYHQGRGVTRNALINYFSETPLLVLCAQLGLLVLLVLWTKSRRFARPLPLPHIDRRSKLEFVASMAELQERSRAFDLAIENIYSRTRRVLVRYAGLDYNSPRSEIAARVASRSTLDRHQLETLMRQCEETINGARVNWRQSIDLVKRLREVERTLGLRMRSRDVRQAAENV